jgi:hypothetical protein
MSLLWKYINEVVDRFRDYKFRSVVGSGAFIYIVLKLSRISQVKFVQN